MWRCVVSVWGGLLVVLHADLGSTEGICASTPIHKLERRLPLAFSREKRGWLRYGNLLMLEFWELCEHVQCTRYMILRYIPTSIVFPSILPLSPFILYIYESMYRS